MSEKLPGKLISSLFEAQTPKYSPLYFYGHRHHLLPLLDAAEQAFRFAHPGKRIVRLRAEDLTSAIINKACGNGAELCRLRCGDMLIFEDVEVLSGRPVTQQDFFSLFDFYFERDLPIVLGSAAAPAALPSLEDRVYTQLCGCVICPIEQQ